MNYLSTSSVNRGRAIYPSRANKRGFTLVEMLISLVLSSIIFVSAYQVISNLIQYQVRYGEKSSRQLDRLLLRNMIGHILEKGLHQSELFYRVQKDGLFNGEHDSIRIISRAYSDHFDAPGYRVYQLYVHDQELFVSYQRYDKDSLSGNPIKLSSGLKIESINFSYFDQGTWTEHWSDDKSIPKYVKVNISLPDSASFEWVNQTGRV